MVIPKAPNGIVLESELVNKRLYVQQPCVHTCDWHHPELKHQHSIPWQSAAVIPPGGCHCVTFRFKVLSTSTVD